MNTTRKPIPGLGKVSKVVKKNGWTMRVLFGLKLLVCAASRMLAAKVACGAGILIQAFTKTLGWVPVHKKCGPVRRRKLSGRRSGRSRYADRPLP